MCGITGIVVRQGNGRGLTAKKKCVVLDSIRHRGPDTQGQFADGRVWLGHVRLSILDLSDAASQPMATPDGRYVICYNGEVYNFAELARQLDLNNLRSHSDTEVVLRAFAKLGVDSIKLLNGMFAFAVYDKQAKKVWLVRDRLGIKPLYYRFDKNGLSFASRSMRWMVRSCSVIFR
jgi:asparagine synthase (glutamine-hydrolysing)